MHIYICNNRYLFLNVYKLYVCGTDLFHFDSESIVSHLDKFRIKPVRALSHAVKSRWATWNRVLISCISLNKIYLYIIYLLQLTSHIVKCSDLANSAIKNAFHSFFLLKNKWNMVFALPDLWKTFYYHFFKILWLQVIVR